MVVATQGAELHFTTRGQGHPIMVLSAIGTRAYELQMPTALSEHFQLVFVDLRGGGESTGNASDLSFDVLAEDLETIRRELGAPRVAVLGHSVLGMVAFEYGRRCPDTVSHVITVGTPPYGDMARVSAAGQVFFESHATDERKQVLRDNLAALPAGATLAQQLAAHVPMRCFDPRFEVAWLFEGAVFRPELMGQLLGVLGPSWDFAPAPESLRVPLLLAHGRFDFVVPYTLWEGLAEKVPQATLRLFERSGHQPFLEEPERFAEVVKDWFAEWRAT